MADSSEQMQAKIVAARREAEVLKDRIRHRRDDLADTTRSLSLFSLSLSLSLSLYLSLSIYLSLLLYDSN